MPEIKGGVVRFRPDEISTEMRLRLGPQRIVSHGGWDYLMSFNPTPWLLFEPVAAPTLPVGFVEIFGPRSGTKHPEYWDQELGLYRDNKAPDWADAGQIAVAELTFQNYGAGRLLPYRLTNGDDYVALPNAPEAICDPIVRGFRLPARLVYELPQHGLMIYQGALQEAGIPIPESQLVPFLRNKPIAHKG